MATKTPEGAVGPQTFRSVTAVIVWWLWALFAIGNLIDLAVQGRDHLGAVAAAILLTVTGIAYVTALRPRIIAADDGITVRNPLRDHRIPWALVTKVDIADLLRVHCRRPGTGPGTEPGKDKVVSAWAVHHSKRRQLASEMRTRRAATRISRRGELFGVPEPGYARQSGYARPPGVRRDNTQEAEAARIAHLLNDRAAAEQADPAGQPGRPVSTWSWTALAALGVPALILLIAALV